MISREYNPEKDASECHRIWREVGWVESEKHEKAMDIFLGACRTLVADLNGRPEALVNSTPATLRYIEEDISLSAVCGVTAGYAARKRGLAGRLTAELISLDAADGAEVAGLGIFDQGYYDKLGFGTGPYEIYMAFDPASLRVDIKPPPPLRLSEDDWDLIHRSRLRRTRSHGYHSLLDSGTTRAELMWSTNGFGLGYMDPEDDILSHHFWCGSAKGENGPYTIYWLSYRNHFQLLELLALIRNLGDQLDLVRMNQPSGMQMQDLLRTPFRNRRISKGSKFEAWAKASAYWQIRICRLEECLEKTSLSCEPFSFNLILEDPVGRFLDDDAPWRGTGGSYKVVLGPESRAHKGNDPSLPQLEASVGAFSRMWLGAVPASGLRVTDDLSGPRELIERLDEAFRLPVPRIDWEY